MDEIGLADVQRRREDAPPAEPTRRCLAGARWAALAGLAGAWFAAGSTGLVGYALRRGLTWAAIGCVVLAGWRRGEKSAKWGLSPFTSVVCLLAALAVAVPMIASDLVPLHVFAVALVLLAVSLGLGKGDSPHLCEAPEGPFRQMGTVPFSQRGRKTILLAAEAVAVLGIYRVAYTSIGWFWLFCDAVGKTLGDVVALIAGKPLWIGATFAGLDFLVVMLYLAIRGPIMGWNRWAKGDRHRLPDRPSGCFAQKVPIPLRVGLGVGAVLIGHSIYLNVLALAPGISACLSEPTSPEEPGGVQAKPSLVQRLFEAPPAPDAWHPYPLPKDFDKAENEWVASWPGWCQPMVRYVAESLPDLGQTLRKIIPWNLPILAMLIHLAVGWGILRFLIVWDDSGQAAELPGRAPPRRAYALAGAAAGLAVLLSAVVTLSWHHPDISGKKIVFLDQGVENFLRPRYGEDDASYGWISVGMYGMVPAYLEMYGYTTLVTRHVTEADLKDAKVLVVFLRETRSGPWDEGFPALVWRFVQDGGTLLVLADHTMEPVDDKGKLDEEGTEGELPPFRYPNNYINRLLEPTAIRVLFDSAELVLPGWLHSYEAISHPSSQGVRERGNQYGVVTGASVNPRWPTYPLLIARFGWNDWGDVHAPPQRALLGDRKFNAGEKLGDCILAAEQPYGNGRVVVFGDTTSFINPNLTGAHHYLSRLYAYLADPASTPQDAWRQVAGLILCAALLAVLLAWPAAGRWAVAAACLSVSLAVCAAVTQSAWTVLPDGNLKKPNNLAYIDDGHLNAFNRDPWKPDGIQGFVQTLMRNDFVPLYLTAITPERLKDARLLVSIAPAKEYSKAERKTIVEWIKKGGIFICTTGYERAGPVRSLMSDLRFDIGGDPESLEMGQGEPLTLGHFRSPFFRGADYFAYVRYQAAWPIDARDRLAMAISEYPASPNNLPVVILRPCGRGYVVVIGDTEFAFNKNLENKNGGAFEGLRENAWFWRWLISFVRSGRGEGQVWFPPKPTPGPGAAAPAEKAAAKAPGGKAPSPAKQPPPVKKPN